MSEKKMHEGKDKGVHPAAAALTGLAIGVAAGVAMSALSDKDKRQKAGEKLDEMGKQAKKSYEDVAGEVEKLKDKVRGAAQEAEDTASKVKDSVKRASDRVGGKMEESGQVIEAEVEDVKQETKKAAKDETGKS